MKAAEVRQKLAESLVETSLYFEKNAQREKHNPVLSFEYVDKIPKCNHSNESCREVLSLSRRRF